MKQYRLTPAEKDALLKQADDFIARGWIEPSVSPWAASVLFVPKPNGKLRFCLDYRYLNRATKQDAGTIPVVQELLDSRRLRGTTIFSLFDLQSCYYQVELDPDSRDCTAFNTPYGQYRWVVMPMGLCNAPAVFQRTMHAVLKDCIRDGIVRVYLDDILMTSKSEEEHPGDVDRVLTALGDAQFFCQLPKCKIVMRELKYLGHIVNAQPEGIKPDPKKSELVKSGRSQLARKILGHF